MIPINRQSWPRRSSSFAPKDFEFGLVRMRSCPGFGRGSRSEPARTSAACEGADRQSERIFCSSHRSTTAPCPRPGTSWIGGRGPMARACGLASLPALSGHPSALCGPRSRQAHLRSTLGYLDGPTLSQPEVYLHFHSELDRRRGQHQQRRNAQASSKPVDRYVAWITKELKLISWAPRKQPTSGGNLMTTNNESEAAKMR